MIDPRPRAGTTQNGGSGVDDHIVLHNRMARHPLDRLAMRVEREALGAQGGALVDAHVASDLAGLPDHHAGAVVDEEALADGGAGVDVDAGDAVRMLAHDARDQRDLQQVELVGDAVLDDRLHAGVAEDDLVAAHRRRVASVGRLHVQQHQPLQLRQAGQQVAGCGRGARLVLVAQLFRGTRLRPVCEHQAAQDLLLQVAQFLLQDRADVEAQALGHLHQAEVAGKEGGAQPLQHVDERRARGAARSPPRPPAAPATIGLAHNWSTTFPMETPAHRA